MKYAVILGLALACSLSGCSSPEQKFVWAAKDAAKAKLKDPESARYPVEPYIVRTKGTGDLAKYDIVSACGVIDGKNGFGGYTGGTRYVAWTSTPPGEAPDGSVVVAFDPAPERVSATGVKESPFDQITWNKQCVDATHAPMKTQD